MQQSSPHEPAEPVDVARLQAALGVGAVEHHDSIASTQDRALDLARGNSDLRLPLLIVAESQTAGRGRGANRWWTEHGSLAFSLLVDQALWQVPEHSSSMASLAVAVAIIDAIRPLVADHLVGLHWPNDVFAAGKKVAGILIDVLGDRRQVIGIGLNVNNMLCDAPDEVRGRATSLRELTRQPLDRTALLLSLVEKLHATMRELAADPDTFGARCQRLCLQVGRTLTIDVAGTRTTGRCAGIALDGALLLEADGNWRKFYSGVLCH